MLTYVRACIVQMNSNGSSHYNHNNTEKHSTKNSPELENNAEERTKIKTELTLFYYFNKGNGIKIKITFSME